MVAAQVRALLNKIPDNKMDKVVRPKAVLTFIKISTKGIYKERSRNKRRRVILEKHFLFFVRDKTNAEESSSKTLLENPLIFLAELGRVHQARAREKSSGTVTNFAK